MPDRHDPKLSMRPPGQRKPDKPEGSKSADPLVELARVVSTRSSSIGSQAKPEAPAQAASGGRPVEPPLPSESDLARDLETELLNELQASFSMVPEVAGQNPEKASEPPPAPIAADKSANGEAGAPPKPHIAPEAQPAPQVADVDLSFHPPSDPPRADPARGSGTDDVFNHIMTVEPDPPELLPRQQEPQQPSVAGERHQQPHQARPEAEERPEPPRIKPPSSTSIRGETLASRIARAAEDGVRQGSTEAKLPAEAPRPTSPPQRSTAVRAAPASERHRPPGSAAFRPHPPASQPPAQAVVRRPRQVDSRWDLPTETEAQPTFDPSRFAPLASDDFAQEPGTDAHARVPANELSYVQGEGAFFEEAAPAEEFEAVPGYDDETLLPYPEDDLAAMQPRRSRRGPFAIAALFAVLVIAGATVFMLRSGGASNPPQVIAADNSPTKITPEVAGNGEGDSQSKLIYDRVDPNSEVADSQLAVTGDEPIANIPPIPDDTTSSDVSRVILEGGLDAGQTEESGSTDSPTTPNARTTVASSAPEPAPIGPRKVRTVVVRPDGTIVSSEAVTPGEEPASSEDDAGEVIAGLPPASETPPAPAADENPLLSENFGSEATDNSGPDNSGPAQDGGATESSASIPDNQSPRPATESASPANAPTVVATPGSANGPVDVTPGGRSAAASGGLGGGFLVQVSSQRSEATALETFAELQRRYPNILGDRVPNIQRADLGARGIYYRVRVGYPTREQAVSMCENLKAAGGDCLLATR